MEKQLRLIRILCKKHAYEISHLAISIVYQHVFLLQVPQFLLEDFEMDGASADVHIVVTQPRRIAAIRSSIATFMCIYFIVLRKH